MVEFGAKVMQDMHGLGIERIILMLTTMVVI